MKRICVLMLGLSMIGGTVVANELENGFAAPPDSAKNQLWWHWLQGNVTREGITADLEAMKRVGVGGAQIFNLSEELPAGPAPFMSPQWLELVKHAAAEAERLGLELARLVGQGHTAAVKGSRDLHHVEGLPQGQLAAALRASGASDDQDRRLG